MFAGKTLGQALRYSLDVELSNRSKWTGHLVIGRRTLYSDEA